MTEISLVQPSQHDQQVRGGSGLWGTAAGRPLQFRFVGHLPSRRCYALRCVDTGQVSDKPKLLPSFTLLCALSAMCPLLSIGSRATWSAMVISAPSRLFFGIAAGNRFGVGQRFFRRPFPGIKESFISVSWLIHAGQLPGRLHPWAAKCRCRP